MTTYVVHIQVNGQPLPISRPFDRENDAQNWALDLDIRWQREVRQVLE